MVSVRGFIAFAVLLQSTLALVEFSKSKLYDENDFKAQNAYLFNFCEVGCRIYASVPKASADIAKKIMVHDFVHDAKSLYDISKLSNGDEKGYFEISAGNSQITFANLNHLHRTAPVAVWIVRADAENIAYSSVVEASGLNIPEGNYELLTVMSAEPFTLKTKNNGPMQIVSTLTGFDAVTNADDACTYVVEQLNGDVNSDIQAYVQSPLLTIFFDDADFEETKTAISASVGKGKTLNFDGLSFAASPGFIGCKGQKTYRSSLYGVSTSLKYSDARLFDVAITSFLNTDSHHPVTIKDQKNRMTYKWNGTTPGNTNSKDLTLPQINSLEISWSRNERDLDQSFLVHLAPSQRKPAGAV